MIEFNSKTHTYIVDGVEYPSVTQIIPEPGWLKYVKGIENYRALGIERHEVIKMFFDLGGYERMQDWDDANLNSLSRFLHTNKYHFGDMVAYEEPMFSRKYGFCGTPDIVFEKAIVDYKSSRQKDVYVALQLAGYEILVKENYKELKHLKKYVLYQTKAGKWRVQPIKVPEAREMFLALLQRRKIEESYEIYLRGK